jgi:hypothetical protein
VWVTIHSHNHHLASVPGDDVGHPFDLNDPLEEDQETCMQVIISLMSKQCLRQ